MSLSACVFWKVEVHIGSGCIQGVANADEAFHSFLFVGCVLLYVYKSRTDSLEALIAHSRILDPQKAAVNIMADLGIRDHSRPPFSGLQVLPKSINPIQRMPHQKRKYGCAPL